MIYKLVATLCSIYLCASTAHGKPARLNKNGAMDYLQAFGYADPGRSGNGNFSKAIARFQTFFNIKVTGKLDAATKAEMSKPRCGNGDEVDETGRSASAYRTASKWPKTRLTYRFLSFSQDVSLPKMKATFQRAFRYWSDVTPLQFREVTRGGSDFTIKFARRSHGDNAPFDGRGRVLAHAYFPSNGRVHFDEDEDYSINGGHVNGRPGIDLLAVAVHEIGHALGLHHSNVRGSIMWPSYNGYTQKLKLHSDDIRGIRSLYPVTGVVTPRPPGSCSDKNRNCPGWKRYCGSSRYGQYMKKNCQKTCNTCKSSACTDKNTSCRGWKLRGYCTGTYQSYMSRNCQKSCGKCRRG